MKTQIKSLIKNALFRLDLNEDQREVLEKDFRIIIEYPDKKFGDYSTPVAMELARVLKKAPYMIAEDLKNILVDDSEINIFSEISVVKPGFLNFRLSDFIRTKILKEIQNNKDYGKGSQKNQKVLLEYVSANPTGPLHIGHGRWAAIGNVLHRVLRFSGYDVSSEFYVNDAGNQVQNLYKSVEAVRTGKDIPEDGYHGQFIEDFKKNDLDPLEFFLKRHKETLSSMGSDFDLFFRESSLHKEGLVEQMLSFLKENDFSYEKDGAVWFATEKYGDEKDRVLVKTDGKYTYFAVDIAYHHQKIKRGYDELINVFGADHHGYIGRLNAAVKILSNEKTKLNIIIGQLVSLFRNGKPVKMSKRTGELITLREVIEEIGVDGTRYFLTMRSANTPLEFDIDLAKKSTSDNPVFYIQYAHARIASIFKKADEEKIKMCLDQEFDFSKISNLKTQEVCFHLIKFPALISDIARTKEVYHLNNYLYDLASLFHKLYNETKFVQVAEYNLSSQYLYFLNSISQVFKIGLDLLGIRAPEKM